jgi:outer membrane protein OmpA-like peptidoglycan-associated protein
MIHGSAIRILAGLGLLAVPAGLTTSWVSDAGDRLERIDAGEDIEEDASRTVALADVADEAYCNGDLRRVLRRVLQSCGLLASGEVRGCRPLEARQVATMAGDDFNALFSPLAERAGIIQFAKNDAELDEGGRKLLEQVFADQRGASYFFVVSRASPEGSVEHNRKLSQRRAESVMNHLRKTFDDPDLDREVGLLWLGKEFAQLDESFCEWQRSGGERCKSAELNRSAFVAWIDCRL